MSFRVLLTSTARAALVSVTDRRVRQALGKVIDSLAVDPDKRGKPLAGELSGYRSVRAVGQRWRVIFRVEKRRVVVVVAALGRRKGKDRDDVYALLKRMIRMGLLERDK